MINSSAAGNTHYKVLVVGLTALDIIDYVENFPVEDTADRVTFQRWVKGGNAANTACVLSQLGIEVNLYSSLSAMPQYKHVIEELQKFDVCLSDCEIYDDKHLPVCSCIVNLQNGSRTFLYSPNDLPWISVDGFKSIEFTHYDLVHFEGRGFPATGEMVEYIFSARKGGLPIISCEMELMEELPFLEKYFCPCADILFLSKDILKLKGFRSAAEAAMAVAAWDIVTAEYIICLWGEDGAAGVRKDYNGISLFECPASIPPEVVDTLGAGDTFVAGAIEGFLRNNSLEHVLKNACALAGKKCGQIGFDNLSKTLC